MSAPAGIENLYEGSSSMVEMTPDHGTLRLLKHPRAKRFSSIDTPDQAHSMVALARQMQLSHVGVAAEVQLEGTPRLSSVEDIPPAPPMMRMRSLSLVLVESHGEEIVEYGFTLDPIDDAIFPALGELCRLPTCWIGHDLKRLLHSLRVINIEPPATLWDTKICERALTLGLNNKNYWPREKPSTHSSRKQQLDHEASCRRAKSEMLELCNLCRRYAVDDTFTSSSGITADGRNDNRNCSMSQREAIAVSRLFAPQIARATREGLLYHLATIEMPWVATNAKIEWHGVTINRVKADAIVRTCPQHAANLATMLRDHDIQDACDDGQIRKFLLKHDLLALFFRNDSYSFSKDELKRHQDRHRAIPAILMARRCHDLLRNEALLFPGCIAADQRLHPTHHQLGSDSGRQTSEHPNILGTDYFLRPLVIPAEGNGIGEIDLCQIEVGIAAAFFGDQQMVKMFNQGDVYSSMAQEFYSDTLSSTDREMAGESFKRAHPEKRNLLKIITLGLIYGMTAEGVAMRLNATSSQAQFLVDRFLGLFPQLRAALKDYPAICKIRGYADSVTGLRRHRPQGMTYRGSEGNWMLNHPIQASACSIFKHAGNRLHRLYPQYEAKIIIPFHDAYVFEAPLSHYEAVAQLTCDVMIQSVQEFYPQLRPRVERNLRFPHCWNKDGAADLIDRWLNDPLDTH